MKEFFLILLLGKSIVLTSEPVDISNEWISISIEKPISAINAGASLNIQLSINGQIIKEIKKADNHFKELKKIIPDETVEAILFNVDGDQIAFSNQGFSISDHTFIRSDSVWVTLKSLTHVPPGKRFNTLKIKSKKYFQSVKIIWKNYRK